MPLYFDVLGWKKVYIVYLYAYWAKIRRTLVFTNYTYTTSIFKARNAI